MCAPQDSQISVSSPDCILEIWTYKVTTLFVQVPDAQGHPKGLKPLKLLKTNWEDTCPHELPFKWSTQGRHLPSDLLWSYPSQQYSKEKLLFSLEIPPWPQPSLSHSFNDFESSHTVVSSNCKLKWKPAALRTTAHTTCTVNFRSLTFIFWGQFRPSSYF